MAEILTIEHAWLEDEQRTTVDKLKAIREQTAGCPCDRCVSRDTCRVTGHECRRFLDWVQRPTTKEAK